VYNESCATHSEQKWFSLVENISIGLGKWCNTLAGLCGVKEFLENRRFGNCRGHK
jgi:hypothetical protein